MRPGLGIILTLKAITDREWELLTRLLFLVQLKPARSAESTRAIEVNANEIYSQNLAIGALGSGLEPNGFRPA